MKAVLRLISITCFATLAFPQNSIGVFTAEYNPQRTSSNRQETILVPANVNQSQFGKIFSYAVDGQIFAQPLWVYGVKIPGLGTHNVVYVETQMDSVYAFDADGKSSTPLWQDSFIDFANGISPIPCSLPGVASCAAWPYFGIMGTPVIDPSTNTMYLIARTYNSTTATASQTLHALDITSGVEKFGGPVEIAGSVPGSGLGSKGGMVPFNALSDIQRAGLLLLNGEVYIGWAGAEHGWIMDYDATSLTQKAVFATTPNANLGGIWQSGNGLASDSDGYIYLAVGDALFDADLGGADYGDSVLKLDQNLNVVDYFTPMDQACRQANDMDLGSSGPLILPTQPGAHPEELLQTGKGGSPCDSTGFTPIYLLDRTNLGQFNPSQDNVIEEISGSPHGYWSSAAYAYSFVKEAVYLAGTVNETGKGDYLKMYLVQNGQLSATAIAQSTNLFPIGVTPAVSSNENKDGIVWAIERRDPLSTAGLSPDVLYAYSAASLSTLYASNQNPSRDQGGCGSKFQIPTVVNGKVFVATQNELDIFGLLPAQQAAVSISLAIPCYSFSTQTVGTSSAAQTETVTNLGTQSLTISAISMSGVDPEDFSETDSCTAEPIAPNGSCSISIVFTPSATGPRIASLLISDNAENSPQNAVLGGMGQ